MGLLIAKQVKERTQVKTKNDVNVLLNHSYRFLKVKNYVVNPLAADNTFNTIALNKSNNILSAFHGTSKLSSSVNNHYSYLKKKVL